MEEKRNREYEACLNERAILRLLDHKVTPKSGCFSALGRDGFLNTSAIGRRSHPKISDIVLPFPLFTQSCKKYGESCEDFY